MRLLEHREAADYGEDKLEPAVEFGIVVALLRFVHTVVPEAVLQRLP